MGDPRGDAPEGRGLKVLLVEDNETIRHAFGILLQEHGYSVAEAGSGAEAIAKAAAELPDVVLMDLGLPDGNGLDFTRRLKADPATRGVKVVAITGRALETDQAACLAAGCSGYLAKPVNTEELLRRIPEFLGA